MQSFKKIKVENAQEKLFRHRILSGLFLVLFNIQLTFVNDELTCTMTGLKPWSSGDRKNYNVNCASIWIKCYKLWKVPKLSDWPKKSAMELFSRRILRLYQPKCKAVLFVTNHPKLCWSFISNFQACLTVGLPSAEELHKSAKGESSASG